jgi:hypothetical protein
MMQTDPMILIKQRACQPGAVTSTEVTGQSGQSKLHLATQHERHSRMAWRGTCCGTAQAELGAPGGAASASAGAGGEEALVGNRARKQLYATHHGSAGGGPESTQRRCQ